LKSCDYLQESDCVMVTKGPLAGLEGTLLRFSGDGRLMLSVSLVQKSIAIEIDRSYVELVNSLQELAPNSLAGACTSATGSEPRR
jgi:transcription antitermination factor NusG